MWINYALLAGIFLLVVIGVVIACKMFLGEKKFSTPNTTPRMKAMLEEQNRLNREIHTELREAGWWQTKKWKKELGKELYDFYYNLNQNS